MQWDQLNLVSLALPTVTAAVVSSPSNLVVTFAEPVKEGQASDPANYRLACAGGTVMIRAATLSNPTNVNLLTPDDVFDPISGFPLMKALQVKVARADSAAPPG